MKIVKQSLFDRFICIADKCIDTCCQGWEIVADDGSVLPYEDGKCIYLNDSGLCKLVLAGGEEAICRTCHLYPRHEEEYDGVREWSLSLSCPEAARMIMSLDSHMEYVVEENDDSDPLEDDYDDFDYLLYSKLEDSREIIYRIIRNTELDFDCKLRMILKLGWDIQLCLDEDRFYDMDAIISEYDDLPKMSEDIKGAIDLKAFSMEHLSLLNKLEVLRPDWNDVLKDAIEFLEADGEAYVKLRGVLRDSFIGNGCNNYELIKENILETFIYTYFLGAAYDGMIYSKIALSVFSIIMIEFISMARAYKNKNQLTFDELIEITYRFAREVEHSDDNLNAIQEYWDMQEF